MRAETALNMRDLESGHESRDRGRHRGHDGRGRGRRRGVEASGDGGAGAAGVGAAAVAAALPQPPTILLVAPLLLLGVVADDAVPGAGCRLGDQAGHDHDRDEGGEDHEHCGRFSLLE